jgi:hypothetical protein
VAKAWYPANLAANPPGFHSKDAGQGSWLRAEKLPTESLGGRVPDYWDGPIRRKPNSDLIPANYTRLEGFSQALMSRNAQPNLLQINKLQDSRSPSTLIDRDQPQHDFGEGKQQKLTAILCLKKEETSQLEIRKM